MDDLIVKILIYFLWLFSLEHCHDTHYYYDKAAFSIVAQETTGFIEFLSSTKQTRQLPAIDKSL
jgi:hypothetical protein